MTLKGAWKVDGFYKADASKVLDELSELGDEYSLSDVVEKAKDKNSEMHSIFEWDDSVAGEEYRKIQAGKMVRNLVIVRNDETEEKTNVRYFVSTGKRDSTFPVETIVELINNCGAFLGIGSRRGEGYGRYHVENVE